MARSFSDVLAEVTARSDPQRQTVLNQVADLPNQQAADEASLEAKRGQANEDIMLSARRRGVANWGAPIAEQQKYAATDYAPALANLKSTYGGRKATLESALSGIGQNDYSTAYNMFNQDRTFEEQQRQFNASNAAKSNPFAGLFDPPTPTPQADPLKLKAQSDVANLLTKDQSRIEQEYRAIKASAGYGNTYDKLKLQLLEQYNPNLAKTAVPTPTPRPTSVYPSVSAVAPYKLVQPTSPTGLLSQKLGVKL